MTLGHALVDSWAYLMVVIISFAQFPTNHPIWRFLGILAGVCWLALIALTWVEYSAT